MNTSCKIHTAADGRKVWDVKSCTICDRDGYTLDHRGCRTDLVGSYRLCTHQLYTEPIGPEPKPILRSTHRGVLIPDEMRNASTAELDAYADSVKAGNRAFCAAVFALEDAAMVAGVELDA